MPREIIQACFYQKSSHRAQYADNVHFAYLRMGRQYTVIHRITQAQDSLALSYTNHFTELQQHKTLFGNVDIIHLSHFTGKQTITKVNQNPRFLIPHSVLSTIDPTINNTYYFLLSQEILIHSYNQLKNMIRITGKINFQTKLTKDEMVK